MASPSEVIEYAPNSPQLPLSIGAAGDSDSRTVVNMNVDSEDLQVEVPGEIHPSADEPNGEVLPTADKPHMVRPEGYYGVDDELPTETLRNDSAVGEDVNDTAKESTRSAELYSATSPPDEDAAVSPAVGDADAVDEIINSAVGDNALQTHSQNSKQLVRAEDEQEREQPEPEHQVDPGLSDFERMMEEKRAQRRSSMHARRRRKDADLISDFDEEAQSFVTKMTKVSDRDRALNEKGKIAPEKLLLLPQVLTLLRRRDMQSAFLDHKVLHSLAHWLSPMPDSSLPPLEIREGILKLLPEFRDINPDHLKSSGIGKAIMLLYKHPKETKGNKKLAQHIITEWSKPIFGIRDEYDRRDKDDDGDEAKEFGPRSSRGGAGDDDGDGIEDDDDDRNSEHERNFRRPDKRRIAVDDEIRKKLFAASGESKSGQTGAVVCPRARVPHASTTDYINRPKSQVVIPQGRRQAPAAQKTRMDVLNRRALMRKVASSQTRAQTVSLSGKHVG